MQRLAVAMVEKGLHLKLGLLTVLNSLVEVAVAGLQKPLHLQVRVVLVAEAGALMETHKEQQQQPQVQ
jgi:hypothetical protein